MITYVSYALKILRCICPYVVPWSRRLLVLTCICCWTSAGFSQHLLASEAFYGYFILLRTKRYAQKRYVMWYVISNYFFGPLVTRGMAICENLRIESSLHLLAGSKRGLVCSWRQLSLKEPPLDLSSKWPSRLTRGIFLICFLPCNCRFFFALMRWILCASVALPVSTTLVCALTRILCLGAVFW